MQHQYHSLVHSTLPVGTQIVQPGHGQPGQVDYSDPAIRVMTDLEKVLPFSISPFSTLDDANNKMIICGVRLLFVVNNQGMIIGLITATDLLGEKPILYMREHSGSRNIIQVQDIMTPQSELEAIDIKDVEKSCVGDIVKTIEQNGRQHLIVYQHDPYRDNCILRGIFSSTQVSRQLNTEIPLTPRANTFAQLNKAISH